MRAITLAHLRPPFLLSVLIRINQNLAELIRYPPRNFDRFRLISINYEDTIARTYSCTVPTPKHLLQHFHSCAPSLSRTCPTTRTQPPRHTHTSTPTPLRIYDTTLTHLRHHSRASTTPLAHNRPATLTHLRHHSRAPTTPHSRICDTTRTPSSSIYTHWRPPLRTFVLPSLFRSLSESIRIYPSLSDILRKISMGPD